MRRPGYEVTGAGCERALELGCMFSIDPDAHPPMKSTISSGSADGTAKGGVPKDRVSTPTLRIPGPSGGAQNSAQGYEPAPINDAYPHQRGLSLPTDTA